MEWTEITVATTTEGAEAVSALFFRAGATGTVIEDRRDLEQLDIPASWNLVDAQLLENAPEFVRVKCYLPCDERLNDSIAYIGEQIELIRGFGDYGPLTLSCGSIREADWANEWKKFYKPIRIGRFLIKPVWEDHQPAEGDLVLQMDPGMAFGTGTHESTAMCLELIDQCRLIGLDVLDIGCGSGILGIAAALAGAGNVLCIDVDPIAVSAARSNIALNGLTNAQVRQGDLLSDIGPVKVDLVVVNIIADVIISLLDALPSVLNDGAQIIASGIISGREQNVIDAAAQRGFVIAQSCTKGEWRALRMVRHA